jgi:hypothetical protein
LTFSLARRFGETSRRVSAAHATQKIDFKRLILPATLPPMSLPTHPLTRAPIVTASALATAGPATLTS